MQEGKYIEAVGRRKTSIARVRVTMASKQHIVVNDKESHDYFPLASLQNIVKEALAAKTEKYKVTAVVKGGGIHAQAEAIRLGIARALASQGHEERGALKKLGFLKRDPRSKERRKFGLKKARKAPQWSKR